MSGYKTGHAPNELEALISKALNFVREKKSVTRKELVDHLVTKNDGVLTNKVLARVVLVKGYVNDGRKITYTEPSKYL